MYCYRPVKAEQREIQKHDLKSTNFGGKEIASYFCDIRIESGCSGVDIRQGTSRRIFNGCPIDSESVILKSRAESGQDLII